MERPDHPFGLSNPNLTINLQRLMGICSRMTFYFGISNRQVQSSLGTKNCVAKVNRSIWKSIPLTLNSRQVQYHWTTILFASEPLKKNLFANSCQICQTKNCVMTASPYIEANECTNIKPKSPLGETAKQSKYNPDPNVDLACSLVTVTDCTQKKGGMQKIVCINPKY